jgi:hypothetical protein
MVYSAPFITYTDANGDRDFTVPEGFVAVIRDVEAYCGLGALSMNVEVNTAEGELAIVIASILDIGVNSSSSWHGRVVVPAGCDIHLNVSSVDLESTVYVGGYLLTPAI